MKNLISLFVIPFVFTTPVEAQIITINVGRVCAAIVDIPYASDNFSDEEFEKWKGCMAYLQHFDGVE